MTIAGKILRLLVPVASALLNADLIPLDTQKKEILGQLTDLAALIQLASQDGQITPEEAAGITESLQVIIIKLS